MEAAPSSSRAERVRFEAELEFVQSLANPEYLHFLAQHRYFDDPDFVSYLRHLSYWQRQPYCLHIAFPHCLRMLELLQNDTNFVEMLKRADFKDHVLRQQQWHWRWRAMEQISDSSELMGSGATAAAAGGAGGAGSEEARASDRGGT
jgi:mediator of RNA polymerase II transcription subunit 31